MTGRHQSTAAPAVSDDISGKAAQGVALAPWWDAAPEGMARIDPHGADDSHVCPHVISMSAQGQEQICNAER
jgi:hypothetical protein